MKNLSLYYFFKCFCRFFFYRNNSRCWSDNLNVRHNQDNQRDFEERAAVQMVTFLTKKTMTENLVTKSYNKQHHGYKTKQPIGMFHNI